MPQYKVIVEKTITEVYSVTTDSHIDALSLTRKHLSGDPQDQVFHYEIESIKHEIASVYQITEGKLE